MGSSRREVSLRILVLVFRLDGECQAHGELEGIPLSGRQGRRGIIQVTVDRAHGKAQIPVRRKGQGVRFRRGVCARVVVGGNVSKSLRISEQLQMRAVVCRKRGADQVLVGTGTRTDELLLLKLHGGFQVGFLNWRL